VQKKKQIHVRTIVLYTD